MERFIADLVKAYESGKIDRREFCKTVTLAATVYAAGDAAKAQAPRGFKMIGINHISYTCPDYNKVRDWYISVLGMESTPGKDSGKRAKFQVKEGDRVLFTSYGGQEVTVDGDEYLILTEDDILAVVD